MKTKLLLTAALTTGLLSFGLVALARGFTQGEAAPAPAAATPAAALPVAPAPTAAAPAVPVAAAAAADAPSGDDDDSTPTTPAGPDAYCDGVIDPALEPRAALSRGEALAKLGQLAEAREALCSVVRSDAADLQLAAHEKLRRVFVAQGRAAGFAELLARCTDLAWSKGDRELANRRFDEVLALDPQFPHRSRFEAMLNRLPPPATDAGASLFMRLRSGLGAILLLGLCWLLSNNRKRIDYRLVAWGMGLQLLFAVIVLWTPPGKVIFSVATDMVNRLLAFTDVGAGFLFGSLYGGLAPLPTRGPIQIVDGTSGDYLNLGLVFAFHILPTIIFFGALMSVLYHLGLIQKVVHAVAWVMRKSMRTSGSESLASAVNIFVGQTEAPLVVKPYLHKMTSSELMAVMVGGFAGVAGGVLAAYVRFGIDAGHLVAASVMGAPGSLMVAKIMFPETEESETRGGHVHDPPRLSSNVIDAATEGASDGLRLALNVAAMLVAFMALIAMLNAALGGVGGWFGHPQLSLGEIFGYLFYPVSWAMGIESKDMLAFGQLMGLKISLNEFVAYVELGNLRQELSPRTFTIATYALCGFANFASIGIQIGGIGAMAPERRGDLAKLGMRAMIGGAITTQIMACIAGMLI